MKEFDEARAFNKIKLTTKTGINHSSFEINQTLSSVIKQSGTHTRKIGMDHIQLLFKKMDWHTHRNNIHWGGCCLTISLDLKGKDYQITSRHFAFMCASFYYS